MRSVDAAPVTFGTRASVTVGFAGAIRTHHAVPIQQVRASEVPGLVMAGCIVALDVAKAK
jgi:hypothetical protein